MSGEIKGVCKLCSKRVYSTHTHTYQHKQAWLRAVRELLRDIAGESLNMDEIVTDAKLLHRNIELIEGGLYDDS